MRRRVTRWNKVGILAGIAFASAFFGAAIANTPESNAAPITDFNAGNIIDDAVFYNKDAMTVSQIQEHLNKYMPACDMWGTGAVGNGRYINGVAIPASTTRAEYARLKREAGDSRYHEPPYVCVQNYYENPETHRTLYESKGKVEDGMLSAAQIIYNAAQEYGINPQVLLVLLKKESYVWGDNWPLKYEYDTVMGYACPDNAPCDTKYYGFYNQVTKAAWQLNYYREHIYSYNYRPYATNSILYSPTASCGRKSVYLENIATTSLYIYTPYTPNDGALRNYPGTAECGSYGNRNFYMYFKEWFGDTHNISATKATLQNGKYYLYDNSTVFEATRNSDGTYYFKNTQTGLMLAASSEAVNVDTTVIEAAANNATKAQKWYVYALGNGLYNLASAANPSFVIATKNNVMMLNVYGNAAAKSMRIIPINESGVADGDYYILSSINKTYRVDVAGNNSGNGTNIQVWSANDSGAQLFTISYDKNSGFYRIKHKSSGRSVDVSGAVASNHRNIQIYDNNDSCAQRWAIVKTANGYEFYSACDLSYAFDMNGTIGDGANISLWAAEHSAAQRWLIESATQNTQVAPVQVLPNGNYVLTSKVRSSYSIDIPGVNAYAGANLWMWDRNGVDGQIFTITYNSQKDAYTIKTIVGNYYLDLSGGNAKNGTNVQLWTPNTSCAELWKIEKNSDGSYSLYSTCGTNFALDVNGGWSGNGTNLQVWQRNNLAPQKWDITKVENAAIISNGNYVITSKVRNNYAIDIPGVNAYSGANLWMWDKNGVNGQTITSIYNAQNNTYSFKSSISDLYLDLSGGNAKNGTNVQLWTPNTSCAQSWKVEKNSDGSYSLYSTCGTNYALDVTGGWTGNGTNLQIWQRNNLNPQKWIFTKK